MLSFIGGIVVFEMGAAIVQRLAVWSPEGKDFQFVGVVLDVPYLIILYVVGDEVALRVKDLYLVTVDGMEREL